MVHGLERIERAARGNSLPAFVVLVSLAGAALAQPDAGSLLRQQELREGRLPERFPEAAAPEAARPALKKADGVRVLVKSVRFSGAIHLVAEEELQALVAGAVGKELDFDGLQALADAVTDHLRGKGWLLARAYLPRQDVTTGAIEIAILEGRLDGRDGRGLPFRIMPGGKLALRADPRVLDAIAAAHLQPGAAIREADMERVLLLMNDLPGIAARARLEPGTEEGSTRVAIDVDEGPLLAASLSLDNHGSVGTGREQATASLNFNDPLGLGDDASLAAIVSDGTETARLGYGFPLGADGLRASLGTLDMRYKIVSGAGVATGLAGGSGVVQAGLSQPFLRSRAASVYGRLGFSRKDLRDDGSTGPLRRKRADVWTLGLSGDSLDGLFDGGLNNWNAGITEGALDLSGVPADKAADAASLKTQGRYAKLAAGASRLQKLPGMLTLLGRFSAQWAGKNLDSSEEFILGGPNGVRAYPGSEASGDEGWLATLELRADLSAWGDWGAPQVAAFVDGGGIRLHHTPGGVAIATATGRNAYTLTGAGLGLSLTKPGSHSLRLVWAAKVGTNPGRTAAGLDADGKNDSSRVWLQGQWWF